ncbi:ORF19 [Fowl aviadenovirus A]|uniref:ORF19 n=1 Tax=Fowl aviadenovirus A TaxID=190061 RepID=A0A650BY17_9ADEN|nr:ORF19 [Fowl aviadenovirus A]
MADFHFLFFLKLGNGGGVLINSTHSPGHWPMSALSSCFNGSDSRWDPPYPKADVRRLMVSYSPDFPSWPKLIVWWNETFLTFSDGPWVVSQMRRLGILDGKDSGELIILIQDMYPDVCPLINRARYDGTYKWTSEMMRKILRMHTIMTPESPVILLDWTNQLRDICKKVDALLWGQDVRGPAYYAVRTTAHFFTEFKDHRIHCIGMSLGGTVCAALSRQLLVRTEGQKRFARIVALDPPLESFQGYRMDSHTKGLNLLLSSGGHWSANRDADSVISRDDADYVVVIASSIGSYGFDRPIGDEYIRSDLTGHKHEACESRAWWKGQICAWSYAGRRHCEDVHIPFDFLRSDGLCYHIMAPLTFMKALDTHQADQLLSMYGSVPSAWSAYVTGRDYSQPTQYYTEEVADWRMLLREDDMASSYLLLVVTEGNAAELWTYDPYYTKTIGMEHGYSVRWYFIRDRNVGEAPIVLYARGGGVLKFIRLYKGRGTLTSLGARAMTTQEVTEFTCFRTHTYYFTGTKKYDCHPGGHRFDVPRWRSHMNVSAHHLPVPPKCGCLKFPKLFKDYVIFDHPNVVGRAGEYVSLGPWSTGLQAVVTFKPQPRRHRVVLATYWDACSNTKRRVGIDVRTDRKNHMVWLKADKPVSREVWFVSEVDVVRVYVTWLSPE